MDEISNPKLQIINPQDPADKFQYLSSKKLKVYKFGHWDSDIACYLEYI